jgi:hypothetical protein
MIDCPFDIDNGTCFLDFKRHLCTWLYFDMCGCCSVRYWQPTTTSYLDYIIHQVSTLFPLLFCSYL